MLTNSYYCAQRMNWDGNRITGFTFETEVLTIDKRKLEADLRLRQ